MKKLLLSTVLALGWFAAPVAPAQAQQIGCGVNFTPQVGVNCTNVRAATYSAAIKSLVPEATAGTDFFCIQGSATKRIQVNRWEISGTGTAATQVVLLNHHLGLNTGTKAVASTYGPVPNPLTSIDAAATATLTAWNSTGGNPTIGGTVTTIRTGILGVVASTVGIPAPSLVWTFGTADDAYNQRLSIPSGGTTEEFCLNWNGATVTASVLQGYIEWTEE